VNKKPAKQKKPDKPGVLRTAAESQLAHAPKPEPKSKPYPTEKLLYELQVHQIELEMQNEQLRHAQIALEESRDRYVNLYEFAPVGYLTLTDTGMIGEINLTGAKLLGTERKKLLRRRFSAFVTPEHRERWDSLFTEVLRKSGEIGCEILLMSGEKKHFYAQLNCMCLIKEGAAPVVRATLTDITARKQADELLRKSVKEVEDLYNRAPCGYHSLDKDGIIRRINDTELSWLGYTRDEVIGKMKWPDLLTPTGIQLFRKKFPQLMEEGIVRDIEIEITRKDGTIFNGLINATAVYDPSGNFMMSRSTVTDITMRKQMEHQLRSLHAHLQTIREEEKASIAREIHDDLGGTLTAIKMESYRLAEELSADENAVPFLVHIESMAHLIDNAVNVTRRVITGLRPTILDDFGLLAALEWQAAQFQKRTGIECLVNCAVCEGREKKLDRIRSINLFRIFQEALTNVSRHSSASHVEVEFHHDDEEVSLSISDNGRGMGEKPADDSIHYGMLGMTERANQLGGKVKFSSPPGGGFNVEISLPLDAGDIQTGRTKKRTI